MPRRKRRILLWTSCLAAISLTLAACTDASSEEHEAAEHADGPAFEHIHGVAIDPSGDRVLLATHDGLFEVGDDGDTTHIGPVIDLMGFAVRGPDHFVASGHPGPDVDLPQPVGLIESTDGGRTWRELSRQGQSDFHALTVGEAGVLGYDGTLVRSADGHEWEELTIPAQPASLAASPDGRSVLATTQQGLLRSPDGGASWNPVDGAPLLQIVDWADAISVVGVDPSGQVWRSADAGATWYEGPRLGAAPQAIAASLEQGSWRILVVTTTALLESVDGGQVFDVLMEH
ncbi:F510_1955 family glycosylhydrolase [Blastococcus litoris]|uniref:F510_1955 family glycosylhydrolase n=1 Tax=Blastococcus litoris TaxID=2171622 RepID=UPI001F1311F3|nr:exo-alpha-sialidase [Blastococcus litoris]